MNAMEATVEIVKSIVQQGGNSTISSVQLLTRPEDRTAFLQGITELYVKLYKLQSGPID